MQHTYTYTKLNPPSPTPPPKIALDKEAEEAAGTVAKPSEDDEVRSRRRSRCFPVLLFVCGVCRDCRDVCCVCAPPACSKPA